LHFINREDEGDIAHRHNRQTMKTMTELHHDHPNGAAPADSRTTRRFLTRLRARIGATGRDRGATAVEFALVAPILVVLTFGIIEFSSAYHDSSLAADAARAGARVGSAQATNPAYATSVVQAVNSALSSMPSNEPQELWIYKANSAGYPGGGSSFSSCSTNCIKYTWNPGAKAFSGGGGGGWAAATQQACTQPYDQIGVYVKVKHNFVTGLFGTNLTLSDHAVFRLEPVPSSQCA
jgi:hypothetical protein